MKTKPTEESQILFEDNHLIIINKKAGEIVQADASGTIPMPENIKAYLKQKFNKPGNVFLGVVHRLDQPTSGAVIFAKTSKALTRLNKMLKLRDIRKTYLSIVNQTPEPKEATLTHFLWRNQKNNKTTTFSKETENSKKAILNYKVMDQSENHALLEIDLITGRHHQIRAQLQAHGNSIRNDLKYGAKRINSNYEGIFLHAFKLNFIHPVGKEEIEIKAPIPWPEIEVKKLGLSLPN